MNSLSALLKKYNCIRVEIGISGSLTLRVLGSYDELRSAEPLPLSEIVYIDDFPPLMNAFYDFAASSQTRLNTHFRMEYENELHWAYLCCEKTGKDGSFGGILLDVYEYLDCIPNDSVFGEFEKRQKRKISEINRNGAGLEEILGRDYLSRVLGALTVTGYVDAAFFDENGRLICEHTADGEPFETKRYNCTKKAAVRFNYKMGGSIQAGTNRRDFEKQISALTDMLAENMSRIAHSSVMLYNEIENAKAVNRQLGANVEQQMLINSIYSVIMEEPQSQQALYRVLEMTARFLGIDRIAAYLPCPEGSVRLAYCYKSNENLGTQADEYIKRNFPRLSLNFETSDNYFSRGDEAEISGLTAFAVSKIYGGEDGTGLLFYEIYSRENSWQYNDRKVIRSVSQVISDLITRCGMDSEIEEKNKQLYRLAFFDNMLGIRNRARLDLDAEEALTGNESGIAMAVRIANTRSLNEVFGQSYTDRLLRMMAEYLSSPDVGGESVYRYSGSIMLLLMKNKTEQDAQDLANKIIARFSEPFFIDGVEQYAETSIGIAAFSPSVSSSEELFRAATLSLYRANEYGKNSFAFFNAGLSETSGLTYHLEQELRRCIADNMRNFELTYQPVFCADEIHHYEALLRWHSENAGNVSPRIFMKLMEKVGLDSTIDFWVLPEACAFCRRMREKTGQDLNVSVNLTTHEMQSGAIAGAVLNALDKTGLEPAALIVEVPEAAFVFACNETAATLGKLKKMGIRVCIDSFGREYLPLTALKYSFVDIIKLDTSFITNSGDSFDRELVRTTVNLAQSRGNTVIAKNIEHSAQRRAADLCGISLIQGGLLSPPLSEDKIIRNLCVPAI